MRNKRRIKELEMQVLYLTHHVELISNTLLELLEKEDKREQEAKNIDSGKWYKTP